MVKKVGEAECTDQASKDIEKNSQEDGAGRNTDAWYKDGLKFKCTECGKCCTGGPGYVWIEESEIIEMAAFLKITVQEFKQRYTRYTYGRLALIENKTSYDCVFLKDKQCRIYGARPKQCRKYPWWSENLKTRERWNETAVLCEGIDHPDAPLISFEKIEEERCK